MHKNIIVLFIEDYQISCQLGDGGQANVYLGKKLNKLFAIKLYHNQKNKMISYQTEVQLLQKINFPHIIKIIEHKPNAAIKCKYQNDFISPIIVLEFAQRGELHQMVNRTGRLSQNVSRTLFKQLISAIKYLHDKNIVHKDIKLQNILFDQHFNLKLADFGLSRNGECEQQKYLMCNSPLGTQGYKAPEIKNNEPYDAIKVDIFAAGVSLFIMYTRSPPFENTSIINSTYNLIRNQRFDIFWNQLESKQIKGFYSEQFKSLMNKIFSAKPKLRPTIEELATDKWMNGVILSQTQLQVQLQPRYLNMTQKVESLKTVKKQQLKLMMEKLESYQGSLEDRKLDEDSFDRDYCDTKIDLKLIPERQMYGLVYNKMSPTLLIYWLRVYLKKQFQLGYTFISNFHLDMKPVSYQLSFKQNSNQLLLECSFEIGKDSIINMKIGGRLYRQNGSQNIGIKWKGMQGNECWLLAIISQLLMQQQYLQ